MAALVVTTADPTLVCDFCADPNVVATHICDPHVMDERQFGRTSIVVTDQDGLWAACSACDGLIKAENWTGLYERSVNRFIAEFGSILPFAREYIRHQHELFRATRKREA